MGDTATMGGVTHVGGARFGPPQLCTIRGRTPRRCGSGCAWESALDTGWHGFPKSAAVKHSAVPRQGVPASHGASCRRTGGGRSGGSDPTFFAAGAPPGRVKGNVQNDTLDPLLFGVAPPTVISGGKAEMLKTWTWVVVLNLALTAVGLWAWLSPWPAPPYSKGSGSSPVPWAR